MGLKNLQIIFDDPTAVFEPGKTITGRVLVVADGSVKIKKIKLKFRGECQVHWKEKKTRKNHKNESENYYESYNASEEYLNFKIILEGGEDGTFKLEGEHVYPFSVSLPLQLPSTFKEEYGKVEYKAIVTVVIPWSINKSTEIDFEVRSPLNLNDDPSLAEPKIQETEKYFCCCFCKSGPMTMIVYVPYCGFVPGQSIPVTIEIDNNSNVDVDTVKIRLDRELEFKSSNRGGKIKSKSFKINNKYLLGIKKHTSKTWTEQIIVPDGLICTNLKHCGIIKDTYFINVEACVKGGHLNEKASIGLTLGDVPLSIARNPPQYGHSFQASDQYFAPHEPFPKDSYRSPMGLEDLLPLPGYVQQIAPCANDQQCVLSTISSSLNRDPEKNSEPLNRDQPPSYQFSDPTEMSKNNEELDSLDLQAKY